MPLKRFALAFALTVGCAAMPAQADDLASLPSVFVREIRLEQNELIPAAVIESATASYLNRSVSAAELQAPFVFHPIGIGGRCHQGKTHSKQ